MLARAPPTATLTGHRPAGTVGVPNTLPDKVSSEKTQRLYCGFVVLSLRREKSRPAAWGWTWKSWRPLLSGMARSIRSTSTHGPPPPPLPPPLLLPLPTPLLALALALALATCPQTTTPFGKWYRYASQ